MSIFNTNATIDFFLESATTYAEKRKVYAMTEADISAVGNSLISKLYRSAISKSYVDFDEIPSSKGDVTKYSGYADMVQCLSIVEATARKANVNIPEIATINRALSNIVGLRDVFTKGFSLNKDFLILQYNTIVATCVEATTCIISSFVEYTKKVDTYEFKLVGTNASQGKSAVANLETFNKSVASGDYTKIAHLVLKTDATKGLITESAVVITVAVISAIIVLVTLMREIVFRIFYARMKISDFLKVQAIFLDMNRANIEAKGTGMSPDKKKIVIKKQAALAAKLMDLSEKIKVNDVTTGVKIKAELKKDNSTMTLTKVTTDMSNNTFELL